MRARLAARAAETLADERAARADEARRKAEARFAEERRLHKHEVGFLADYYGLK